MNLESLDRLIPSTLSSEGKGRLRDGLSQFFDVTTDKVYTNFYSSSYYDFFLQGDLLREVRFSVFDFENYNYNKQYFDAIILSNDCDIDVSNERNIPKQIMLAKLIPLDEFLKDVSELKPNANIASLKNDITRQNYTNLFYLPQCKDGIEYIAFFDDISIISVSELDAMKEDFSENRIDVLDYFGFYLFVFKLSYHFCRLPEDDYRI